MAIVTDNTLDGDLRKMKVFLEDLKRTQAAFANSFQTMRPKDRAGMLHQIQSGHKTIQAFIDKAKKTDVLNSGARFAMENLKQSFNSALVLWRRTEKNLENFTQGSSPKQGFGRGPMDETQRAVDQYASALREIGHTPNTEMINEFKSKLEVAYAKAKEKSGGRELDIKIVHEGSKIKVRMEPK